MKEWSFYVQFNGDEVSSFDIIRAKIPDKLYDKVQKAIERDLPLEEQPFYDELIAKAEKAADKAAVQLSLEDFKSWGGEKPIRADYDDYEDYKEALEEYNEERASAMDSWCWERIDAEDPGAYPRFKKKVVGLSFPQWAGESKKEIEYTREDEAIECFSFTLFLDEKGTVIDVSELEASGLESETMKSSSFGDSFPDYDFVYYHLLDDAGISEDSI